MHAWLTGGSAVKAIVGHFGSGKTEIALNAALYLNALGRAVRLIDLDIVNPFFRSAERAELLRAQGIEVIHPQFALSGVDIPALGPEIERAFVPDGAVSILDVGGDDSGAAALGRFKPRLDAADAELYYVVNPFRPRSSTLDQILDLFSLVEKRARVRVSGILANSNIGGFTAPETLLEGRALIESAARALGVPVVAECGTAQALRGTDARFEKFEIARYLKPEWMEN